MRFELNPSQERLLVREVRPRPGDDRPYWVRALEEPETDAADLFI